MGYYYNLSCNRIYHSAMGSKWPVNLYNNYNRPPLMLQIKNKFTGSW